MKNVDDLGLPILKFERNMLLHMSNRFLEAFPKFETR